MVGGWKRWLLKPVDPFLKKNGAGLELPIQITGTNGDMHFGLALEGADQTPKEMLADIKQKERDKEELRQIKRELEQADAEDAAAAKATSLDAAERAHNAAVKRRTEAMSRLQSTQRGNQTPDR
jgi:hypothetical protein